jgi:MFS family permease
MQSESPALKTEQFNRPLLAVVAGATFLSALGSSVLNVSMPDIARTFDVDPSKASWYMLAFLLTVTVMLLPAGRLGDHVGHGRVYLAGFAVFGLGCLACALAPSSGIFIASRALAGLGSAFVMATSPALLTQASSPTRRGTSLGLMSTATYVGLTIGPPLGGEMLRWGSWRLVFWGSLVASIVVIIPSFWVLPLTKSKGTNARFDILGALIIAVGTLAFLLLCTRGPAWGIHHPGTIASAVVAIVLVPALFLAEGRHPSPTIDLRMFGSSGDPGIAIRKIIPSG